MVPGIGVAGGGVGGAMGGDDDEPLRFTNAHRHIIKHIVNHHEKLRRRNPDLHYIALFFVLMAAPVCLYFIRAYHDLHKQALTRIVRARNAAGSNARSLPVRFHQRQLIPFVAFYFLASDEAADQDHSHSFTLFCKSSTWSLTRRLHWRCGDVGWVYARGTHTIRHWWRED